MADAYLNPLWREVLQANGLERFEQLWQLGERGWFEPPNRRRGGWSGVVRTSLRHPVEGEVGIFVKLQENHIYRDWSTLFLPQVTFAREFRNLQSCIAEGVPTLELVYYGKQQVDGKPRAILITRELAGYRPLSDADWLALPRAAKYELLRRGADAVRRLHQMKFQHNCLYPKHMFVKRLPDGTMDVRLIDLEKAKRKWTRAPALLRDLGTLHRHAEGWSRSDRLRFFLAYLEQPRLRRPDKALLSKLLNETGKKLQEQHSRAVRRKAGTPD